jgi:hypothetical protein
LGSERGALLREIGRGVREAVARATTSSARLRASGSSFSVHHNLGWHSGQNSSGCRSRSSEWFDPFMPHS